jgi:hypothetical protein
MKNICLKFYGLGIKNQFQADIKILNHNKELVFEGKTYNGEIDLCLNTNECYQLKAILNNEIINLYFFVSCYRDKYIFYFPRSIINRIITFHLTDFYYENLPIEKGEIILWHKQ